MNEIASLINLDKPIVFFDLETTGVKAQNDRIVEISAIKIYPDGKEEYKTVRVNPGIPIPEEATKIHGITDEDVKNCSLFADVAESLYEFFGDSHLSGFSIRNFDTSILHWEFEQAGFDFDLSDRAIIDTKSIFNINEPRDLPSAVKFYCGKDIENHHNAMADTKSAMDILKGQFKKYSDKLPSNIHELNAYCNPKLSMYVDRFGKFIWINKEATFNFGKYSLKSLREVVDIDKNYLEWITEKSNLNKDVKRLVANAIQGKYPEIVKEKKS
ncbi:MAG: hypothetical protein A3F80_03420 [Candidatus Melainabacteria bacterium RIFCSPLOWO2_12_FULL_35_11]|nr:MAG: hypothetical protein A3F80_03420 [Candidatus Melainabacteria bacterium RIFCSPLOWO2_12_FULL_35_11]